VLYNQLTPIQLERLTKLNEECAEVIQIISKIFLHGLNSSHPDNPNVSNVALLEEECGDVLNAIRLLEEIGLVNRPRIDALADIKHEKINQWLHYKTE